MFLPYHVGDECIAKLGDKWYPAKVLSVNIVKSDPSQNRYYVHYPHVSLDFSSTLIATHRSIEEWILGSV